MQIRMTIRNGRAEADFAAIVHRSTGSAELQLDPDSFYRKFASKAPEGIHYELEISYPSDGFLDIHKLHTHRSVKTGKLFVCYPLEIPTLERATRIFEIWCLGVALTIARGIDLNTVMNEFGNDEGQVIKAMRDRYDTYLKEVALLE